MNTSKNPILVLPKTHFETALCQRISLGFDLLNPKTKKIDTNAWNRNYEKWNRYNIEFLRRAFDSPGNRYAEEYIAAEGKHMFNVGNDVYIDNKEDLPIKMSNLESLREVVPLLEENNSVQQPSSSKKNRKPKIFISHSSKDKDFVDSLIDLFEKYGFDENDIFCSSIPNYWVGLQKDFCTVIKEQFDLYNLYVIFIHSPRFYDSPVSMNEMGAAWVLQKDYYSILTSDMDYNMMSGVVSNREIAIKVNDKDAKERLTELFKSLIEIFNKKPLDIKWERNRDKFLKEVNSIRYNSVPQKGTQALKNNEAITFSKEEESIMQTWVSGEDSEMEVVATSDGTIIILGETQYPVSSNKELVRWRDFFDRLETQGLVEWYDYDDNAEMPLCRLTMKGYKLFEVR